jgi:type IV secretion system protein VirB9
MKPLAWLAAIRWASAVWHRDGSTEAADPRLREVVYDPRAVVTVPVKRGVVTLVVLDPDESITEVAAGLGGDCTKADAAWCVAAQPGGRNLFVKAKSSASAANNLAVVTDRRTHTFRFVVLADGDPKPPVYRLVVKAPPRPAPPARLALREDVPLVALPVVPPPPPPHQVVAERLQAKPQVMNTQYSMAEGAGSQDIVPTLVYDDGRFTYLRFPRQPRGPGRLSCAGRRQRDARQRPHGRRPAGGRSRQPQADAARRLGGGRTLERGLRPGRAAPWRRHHRARRAARAQSRQHKR